jgi:hypothetical protein
MGDETYRAVIASNTQPLQSFPDETMHLITGRRGGEELLVLGSMMLLCGCFKCWFNHRPLSAQTFEYVSDSVPMRLALIT